MSAVPTVWVAERIRLVELGCGAVDPALEHALLASEHRVRLRPGGRAELDALVRVVAQDHEGVFADRVGVAAVAPCDRARGERLLVAEPLVHGAAHAEPAAEVRDE